jgi:hypothetical protein
MRELDPEVVARAIRWCAGAGRAVAEGEVRAALEPLGWDEILAVRAVLAGSPPARPLGPAALVDLARGIAPEVAAERERQGRYRSESKREQRAAQAPGSQPGGRPRRTAGVVVRRARDRAAAVPAAPARLPLLDELWLAEGRAALERLVRRLGARRPALLQALAEGWRRPDGTPPGEADLEALLDHHGLARAFDRRERTLLLHALRAAGGVRTRAAAALGLPPEGLEPALRRLGATSEAEAIRDERRREIRRRATLAERASLVVFDEERLTDLGLLEEVATDLRARLPDHLTALRAGRPTSLAGALGRSLSLSRPAVDALARKLGLDLGPRPVPAERPVRRDGMGPLHPAGASRAGGARPRGRAGPDRPRRRPGPGRPGRP